MFAMKIISFVLISLTTTIVSAAFPLRTRELTTSATLEGCYLINIKTRSELLLDDSNSLTLDVDNQGYSVRCDVSTVGRLDFVAFEYDGQVHVEAASPYFMNGDSAAGANIYKVDYLSTCGRKIIKIKGSLNDRVAFEVTFRINVKNPSGASCDSGSSPITVPVPIPITVPVPIPVAPVPVPVPVRTPNCSAKVIGFTLVDAKLSKDIMDVKDYMIDDVPSLLSIRADIQTCRPSVVQSVLINYDGEVRCENFAPYTSFGDSSTRNVANSKANYHGRTIDIGHHYVKATPYTNHDCIGSKGSTVIKYFDVTTK